MHIRRIASAIAGTALALSLTACGGHNEQSNPEHGKSPESSATEHAATKTVTDLAGNTVTIPSEPSSVIVTDNRSFQILQSWGVKLAAAPVSLMNDDIHAQYIADTNIIDLGSHREPNMEGFVAAKPDLVINGQRFAALEEDIKKLLPKDAAFVDVNMPEEMDLADYFHTQVPLLGEIFNKQDEAAQLIADFDAAVEQASTAYNPDQSVMGLVVSGGAINYAAPGEGRSVGPLFPLLGLTPALEQEGSTDHEGDDVSVEAIAAAQPEWMIVLDRDQSVGSEDGTYTPSDEVIRGSKALANVPAVAKNQIISAPNGFYVSEDIISYTAFINAIADAFDQAR